MSRQQRRPNGASGTSLLTGQEVIALFQAAVIVWPHLQHCVQFWMLQYKKDIKLLQSNQKKTAKMVKGLERKTYEECLESLGLFSLDKRRLRGNLMPAHSFLRGRRAAGADFSLVTSDRTHSMKLHQEGSGWIRRKHSPLREWVCTGTDCRECHQA